MSRRTSKDQIVDCHSATGRMTDIGVHKTAKLVDFTVNVEVENQHDHAIPNQRKLEIPK